MRQVLLVYDGAIVGFKMANHMRAERCVDAFTSAIQKHQAFFATLKKECIYKVKTETMEMEVMKSMVFRFIPRTMAIPH